MFMDNNSMYKGSSPKKDQLLLVGNLVLATDHILEAAIAQPIDSEVLIERAKTIDKARVEFMGEFTKDLPEELWCVYKHLAAARVLAQELFKAGHEENLMISINEVLVNIFGSDYEACATCRDDKGEA